MQRDFVLVQDDDGRFHHIPAELYQGGWDDVSFAETTQFAACLCVFMLCVFIFGVML